MNANKTNYQKNKQKGKKSQMEVMGLVVIVILISLVMLVVLVFIVRQPASKVSDEYYHSELATNTINALLRTTSRDCKGHDLTTLAKDCIENFEGGYIMCGEDGSIPSCDYVYSSVNQIMLGTLKQLHKKYVLTVYDPANNPVIKIKDPDLKTDDCPGAREASNPQPLATDKGMMQIQLFLCLD